MSVPDRQAGPALGPPPANMRGFPSVWTSENEAVYRAYQSDRMPVWYSSDGSGRFDLPSPNGTLYLADSVSVAVRERLGAVALEGGRVIRSVVADMSVAVLLPLGSYHCAHITDPRSAEWGVTRELETIVPYDLPRQWAAAFFGAGKGGIRYGARFSPGGPNAWALFGHAGEDASLHTAPDVDHEEACRIARIEIVDIPPKHALDVVDPPPVRR